MWWIWKLLCDQRGIEGDANAGDASADANADAGLGDAEASAENNGEGGEGGQSGDGTQVTPKFGEFGNDPNEAATKLFEAFTKQKGEFDNFKTKAGLTERNLGSIRKALEGSGIRAVEENGEIRFEVAQKQERKTRFTDEHGKMFDPKVLEGMRLLFQDLFDEQYENRERTTKEQRAQLQQMIAEKEELEGLMFDYFPGLDGKFDRAGNPTNPQFNKAFFDKATEIWQRDYLMPNGKPNPMKQLSAALRAAKELNIIPQMITAAKKEGIKIGQDGKKILAPVNGSGGQGGTGGFTKRLSKAEYLALPEEERAKYDQWSITQPKQ